MDICDYSDAGKITMNSVFDACVASYTFADKEVSQTEILQMLRNLGDECETTEPTYPGAELCVVDYVIDGDTLSVLSVQITCVLWLPLKLCVFVCGTRA